MQETNGQTYIEYAPGDNKIILLSWVEMMIRDLYQNNPELFGKLVHRASLSGRADVTPPSIGTAHRARPGPKPGAGAPKVT